MNDTPPDITAKVRQMMMARTGAERLVLGSEMFETARKILLASLPAGLPEIEIRRRLCERLYGNEVNQAGFSKRLG